MVQILRIQGATRVLGQSQGYIGLPVRDTPRIDNTNGRVVNMMCTAWELNPEEIRGLLDGKPLIIEIQGNIHPPIMIRVGELDEPD